MIQINNIGYIFIFVLITFQNYFNPLPLILLGAVVYITYKFDLYGKYHKFYINDDYFYSNIISNYINPSIYNNTIYHILKTNTRLVEFLTSLHKYEHLEKQIYTTLVYNIWAFLKCYYRIMTSSVNITNIHLHDLVEKRNKTLNNIPMYIFNLTDSKSINYMNKMNDELYMILNKYINVVENKYDLNVDVLNYDLIKSPHDIY